MRRRAKLPVVSWSLLLIALLEISFWTIGVVDQYQARQYFVRERDNTQNTLLNSLHDNIADSEVQAAELLFELQEDIRRVEVRQEERELRQLLSIASKAIGSSSLSAFLIARGVFAPGLSDLSYSQDDPTDDLIDLPLRVVLL